jgi:hypothetical protein
MTNNGHTTPKYTDSVSAGSGWIDMLRRTNAQVRTGVVGAPKTAIRQFRDANMLTLLRNLMPTVNPELLQRIVAHRTEPQSRLN